MTLLDDLKRYVVDVQASTLYASWQRDNSGLTAQEKKQVPLPAPKPGTEVASWFAFRDAVLAGSRPAAPSLATAFGRSLVDAVVEYLDATAPVPPPPPAPSTRIYTADFSGDNFAQVDGLQESSPGRITLVSPGLAGNRYAAKILCGGAQDNNVAGGHRTEISVQQFSKHLGGGSLQGKSVWVAWDFRLAAGFNYPSRWMDVGQFHAGASPNSPVFAFGVTPAGQFIIEQRGGSSQSPKIATLASTIQTEHDYQVIVYRLFSVNGDGITKVWLDRAASESPQVSLTGPTLFVGMESLPYMKYGMYGGDWPDDNEIRVSNIRWATTAAGLA